MTAETLLQLRLERQLRSLEQREVLWHHCARPQDCCGTPGFPDVIAISPHGLLVYEIKTASGETSAEQDNWLWTLGHALQEHRHFTRIGVRRPELQGELIANELRWLAGSG